MHDFAPNGISESHAGADGWLDREDAEDTSTTSTDTPHERTSHRGTKCIAGDCRAAPIWLRVR